MTKTPQATNWDDYYGRPFKTASITRKITEKILVSLIQQIFQKQFKNSPAQQSLSILEMGGANSCFVEGVMNQCQLSQYTVFDNNKVGLQKLKDRCLENEFLKGRSICAEEIDLLKSKIPDIHREKFDMTFSVGLIEHFSPLETATMISRHFETTKPHGHIVLFFPTPTFLYKTTRWLAEKFGLWIFHDERPLTMNEVKNVLRTFEGKIIFEKINWPIILTQGIIVFEKGNAARLQSE